MNLTDILWKGLSEDVFEDFLRFLVSDAYGCFSLGTDQRFAYSLFQELEGSDELFEDSVITTGKMYTSCNTQVIKKRHLL